jgi:hypothetical protein
MDGTSGYVGDTDYNYGYYRVLQPDHLTLACLNAGVMPPSADIQHYLELGYGKGLSINIHAASNPGTFWGTDFNANHVVEASCLAAAAGSSVKLLGDSFAELTARRDLPEFDMIAMHGVWSWISAENRRLVIDLVHRRLRVGGLFYVSYDCYPGGAAIDPLNRLLLLHADHGDSSAAGTLGKLEQALGFVQEMAGSDSLYFKENPGVAKYLATYAGRDRSVLAHEAFARHRTVMTFAGVAEALAEARLSFAASVRLLDQFETFNVSAGGQKLLASIHNPLLRQSVFDYLVNQHTRCDIFVKGLRRLTPVERAEALHARSFVLTRPATDLPLTVRGARGEVGLDEQVCRPLLEVLAENQHEPKSLRRIVQHPTLQTVPRPRLAEALMLMTAAGHVSTVREPTAEIRAYCKALNRYLWNRARNDGEITWLASPVIAAGIPASRFEQLFLAAVAMGKESVAEQAAVAWQILSAQGQRLAKDGRSLESAEENIELLTRMAALFTSQRLPILKTLELV